MNTSTQSPAAWDETFLTALEETGKVRLAARIAGVAAPTPFKKRRRDPRFAAAWAESLARFAAGAQACLPAPRPAPAEPAPLAEVPPVKLGKTAKRAAFFAALAETSNVSEAARRATMTVREAYQLRRRIPAFAAAWRDALIEGYELLELELLGYLRDTRPRHKMDVGGALRLLAAHKEMLVRERALRGSDDKEAVLASVDRFIENMRQRRLANAALMLEDRTGDEGEAEARAEDRATEAGNAAG